MSAVDDVRLEVCREIAALHGLDERAATFFAGTTVAEIETSATQLAQLLGTSKPDPQPLQPEEQKLGTLADFVAATQAGKRERQRQLVAWLHLDPQQPQPQDRDAQGRFANARASGSSFDGGARRPLLERQTTPEQDHNEAVLQLARLAKLGGSQF